MKISLSQIKIRTADFQYNYNNILEHFNPDVDLNIFPCIGLEDTNAKSMCMDFDCRDAQMNFYEKLAEKFNGHTVLLGTVLLDNGNVTNVYNSYFDFNGKKIFVSDMFKTDVKCDLYILAKNSYYAMNSHKNFRDYLMSECDFIYVNSIGLSDCDVFAGQSFAKNKDNKLVLDMPILEECTSIVEFDNDVQTTDLCMEEEVYKVTTFALKEYCEITGFKKVLLGLSGGIDSALTAVLASDALGSENVHAIMLPSMYSSKGSIEDSLKLAKKLNISIEEIPITPMFDCFMQKNEKLSDLAEENLQSRLRGMILMFSSNRNGYLLLSTGNKSEVAAGYGTLYGDMCGGLNLIADLTKTNVYKLSEWINRNENIIPREIIEKAPSAELRPNQKDQDSLPEYSVLDDIIEMYCEQCVPPKEIYNKYDKKIVDKVLKLLYRSQFKRNQACTGIRLTNMAFCANVSYPILQKYY